MAGEKLHIGSGDEALPGWINLDALPYPNVDRVQDLTRGLPYSDVAYIYAEHFIEHLTPDQSLSLLKNCRDALAPDGVLRLSTPNLDWVLETHYRPDKWDAPGTAIAECFGLNKAFHGWGHKFLFNRQTLEAFLTAAGFATIELCAYGESRDPELRSLERHERSRDTAQQHVLIAEARGRREKTAGVLDKYRFEYRRDAVMPFHVLQYSLLWLIRLASRTARWIFRRRVSSSAKGRRDAPTKRE
ncbi:MAG TPA: methyltransferase domain-containing protein [Thermoanaerobaculia bacterium]|nr:methyltransferase domain-containing protein [Thermoanaerobaculia bacterium]